MRSDLKLDNGAWDLVITDDIELVENAEMTSQDSKFSLQIIQGEVFDDTRIGVPWLTDMVNPQVSIAARKQILRDTIMRTPGAVELTSLDVAVDNQTGIASCTFEGITDNGGVFGSSIGDVDIPSVTDSGIIAEYDYTTGKSFGLLLERGSEGIYVRGGVLKKAGVNIPRFEDNGLLLEPQATNLLKYSTDINNNVWVNTRSVKLNTETDPLGGMGAVKISASSVRNTHYMNQPIEKDDGSTYTYSVFCKPAENTKILMVVGNFAAQDNPQNVIIDLETGDILNNIDQTRVRVSMLFGGWVRISSTVTTKHDVSGVIAAQVALIDQVSLSGSFVGDEVSGYVTWGGQIEKGLSPTSFIPSSDGAASRASDALSVIQKDARWIYREYIPLGLVSTVKELVEYDGTVSPYGHLQKLKVWNRDPTASERAALGL